MSELSLYQVRKRWKNRRSKAAFVSMLYEEGYERIGYGCFKDVYGIPGGERVIKLRIDRREDLTGDPAPMSRSRQVYRQAKDKSRYIPILLSLPGLHVQPRVRPCEKNCSPMPLDEISPDPYSTNHTHYGRGRRAALIDY